MELKMQTLNCWVYPGKRDVMMICDEAVVDKMTVPPAFVCKLVQVDADTGAWTYEFGPGDESKWKRLVKRFNGQLYTRMPDGTGHEWQVSF